MIFNIIMTKSNQLASDFADVKFALKWPAKIFYSRVMVDVSGIIKFSD
jgi:hypothetical protein